MILALAGELKCSLARYSFSVLLAISLINSHLLIHTLVVIPAQPMFLFLLLRDVEARMKLTEIKKVRSSLRCSHFQNRNYHVCIFENFSRRRCFVSIISASGHRISDWKTATRFALFVDLSLSLLFPARPSSSPFFTFSFAVCFRRHGDTYIHVRAVLP